MLHRIVIMVVVCVSAMSPRPASAFWEAIWGYDSYEECILDKMQGVSSDLASKQIARACYESTKGSEPTPVPERPSKIVTIYFDTLDSEWANSPIFGTNADFRVLVKNVSTYSISSPQIWAKMEGCERNTTAIRAAQTKLSTKGYLKGPADGVVGAATRTAVKKFQVDNGLDATGDLDGQTLRALNVSASAEDFPPMGEGIFIGTYELKPGETAYVNFMNFQNQTGGRKFCFRVGAKVKVAVSE